MQQGPKNFVGALLQIPRNLRNIYLHSLQSYLWNMAASQHVKEFGMDAVQLGDLVLPRTPPLQGAGKLSAVNAAPDRRV